MKTYYLTAKREAERNQHGFRTGENYVFIELSFAIADQSMPMIDVWVQEDEDPDAWVRINPIEMQISMRISHNDQMIKEVVTMGRAPASRLTAHIYIYLPPEAAGLLHAVNVTCS